MTRGGALVVVVVLEVLVVVVVELCAAPAMEGRTANLGWYSEGVSDVRIRTWGVTM